jgi:hypothetical protein
LLGVGFLEDIEALGCVADEGACDVAGVIDGARGAELAGEEAGGVFITRD